MNIRIICVGKIKESFYREAAAELIKRIGRYADSEIIEVAEEKAPEGLSEAGKRQIIDTEGERLLSKIDERDHVIALCIDGKKLPSVAFSQYIHKMMLGGKSRIAFVIGGSLGLSRAVTNREELKLSFSDMTFPHQLFRIMLLEQIYRAFKIINNEPYHK